MPNVQRDAMICRFCENEERASEGYPCTDCGAFICLMCDMRGVMRCRPCQARFDAPREPAETDPTDADGN